MSPDPATLRARLLVRPSPGGWIGLVVRAFPPAGAPPGDGPPHWLAAAWRTDDHGLVPRLPEFALIASPERGRALGELLSRLPAQAPVHLVGTDRVDAALVAELLLESDRNLQPWHRDGLRAFVDAQREADRARIRALYTDRDEGFERLRGRLAGDPD